MPFITGYLSNPDSVTEISDCAVSMPFITGYLSNISAASSEIELIWRFNALYHGLPFKPISAFGKTADFIEFQCPLSRATFQTNWAEYVLLSKGFNALYHGLPFKPSLLMESVSGRYVSMPFITGYLSNCGIGFALFGGITFQCPLSRATFQTSNYIYITLRVYCFNALYHGLPFKQDS